MHDERMMVQVNAAKARVIVAVWIATLIQALIRVILTQSLSVLNGVDLLMLSVPVIHLMLSSVLTSSSQDERDQASVRTLSDTAFAVMLFGGFFLHFNSVASLYAQASSGSAVTSARLPLTSFLVTLGLIVYLVSLRRRGVYAHYTLLIDRHDVYGRMVIRRLLVFGVIFLANVVPFALRWTPGGASSGLLLTGIILVSLSYVSLSVTYLLFAFYEKHTFDEENLELDGTIRHVSKTVPLFLTVPLLIHIGSSVVSVVRDWSFQRDGNMDIMRDPTFLVFQRMFALLQGDAILYQTIALVLLFRHLKKIPGLKDVSLAVLVYLVVSTTVSSLSFIFALVNPLFPSDVVIRTAKAVGSISSYVMIMNVLIGVVLEILMRQKGIPKGWLFVRLMLFGPALGLVLRYLTLTYSLQVLFPLWQIVLFVSGFALFIFTRIQSDLTCGIPGRPSSDTDVVEPLF